MSRQLFIKIEQIIADNHPANNKNQEMRMNQKNKRRTEITIETHEIKIIRITGEARQTAFCRRCQCDAAVFAPAQIAAFLGLTPEDVYRAINDGNYHMVGESATPLVCGNSLKSERKI